MSELKWHYGPTKADPDPGKMWCYDCGKEVFVFKDGVLQCLGCSKQDKSNEEPKQ